MIDKLFPYTGLLGALSLIAWAGSLYVLTQVMRKASRPRIYMLALGLVLLSSMLYRLKNEYWKSAVTLDRTEEIRKQMEAQKALEAEEKAEAEAEAAEQAAQTAAENGTAPPPRRTKDLASGVAFAEDAPADLTQGGYSDSVPTYLERGKQVRTIPGVTNQIAGVRGTNHVAGATNQIAGVRGTNHVAGATNAPVSLDGEDQTGDEAADAAREGSTEKYTIFVKEPQYRLIQQIHRVSRLLINLLLIAVVSTILWNYVVTFNLPWTTWWPLPLSGGSIDAFSPKRPAQTLRPGDAPYAPPEAFLERAIRKGENVIYFGRGPIWASKSSLPRLSLFIPWFGDHADTVWPQARAYLLRLWHALGQRLARSVRSAMDHWNRIAPSWHRRVQATARFLERMDDHVQRILGELSRFRARQSQRPGDRLGGETAGAAAGQRFPQRLAWAGRSLWKGMAALTLILARVLPPLGRRLWQERGALVRALGCLARWLDDGEAVLFRVLPRMLARLGRWIYLLLRVLCVVGAWLGKGVIAWPPQLVRYARMLRRGERKITFVEIPLWCVPILRYGGKRLPTGSEFAFDAAWFGRYVPVMSSDAPGLAMLQDMADIMSERRQSGAIAKRTLLIVWDRDEVVDTTLQTRLAQLAEEGNLSILTWARGP
ncbi:MAG: hypothetical protein FJ222_07585 [Lentisphaerae bacterium]|nr:hypothetical protein [Lentisphaerota bacterium]